MLRLPLAMLDTRSTSVSSTMRSHMEMVWNSPNDEGGRELVRLKKSKPLRRSQDVPTRSTSDNVCSSPAFSEKRRLCGIREQYLPRGSDVAVLLIDAAAVIESE